VDDAVATARLWMTTAATSRSVPGSHQAMRGGNAVQVQIKPGLRRAWRGPGSVQIGLDTRLGTVVDGLTSVDRTLIEQLGTGIDEPREAGSADREPHGDRARELVRLLGDAGVLIRSRAGRAALARVGPQHHRLAPDAEVWSVVHEGSGDAWELLAARSLREVEVVGAGRTGSSLATMLAAAGVGRVRVSDPGQVSPQDVAPAGAGVADVGQPRDLVARRTLHRIGHRQRQPVVGRAEAARPDLVIIVEHAVADAAAADSLLAADLAHLSVVIGEAGATVGPLVVPGRGPCLRCLDLHRADRDPAWPQVLAQLLSARTGAGPEETSCASLTAALACLQALGHLDGVRRPAAAAATLEVELPDGLISRRDWPAHPACGCHWPPAVPSTTRPTPMSRRASAEAPEPGRMPL
jgi:hypothetical protein